MHDLELVYPVFVIWLVSGIVCWVFILGVMLPPCGITFKQLKGRDQRIRGAIKKAMNGRAFWVGFWGSFVCLAINTLAPLGLLRRLPLWSVLGLLALNALGNVAAIPLRLWILHIGRERKVLMTQTEQRSRTW